MYQHFVHRKLGRYSSRALLSAFPHIKTRSQTLSCLRSCRSCAPKPLREHSILMEHEMRHVQTWVDFLTPSLTLTAPSSFLVAFPNDYIEYNCSLESSTKARMPNKHGVRREVNIGKMGYRLERIQANEPIQNNIQNNGEQKAEVFYTIQTKLWHT